MSVKWSAFAAGSAIAGSDITVGLQSGANVRWTYNQAATFFWASPTLVTPTLGVATATSINKVALTAPATSATLTIADGKTLTANASLTLAGTDATTMTFPASSTTLAGLSIANTFTAQNTFAQGTLTASAPFTLTQTLNGVGVLFEAFRINWTDTNSHADSRFLNFSLGGTGIFAVDKSGAILLNNNQKFLVGDGDYNIRIGFAALEALTTGIQNVTIGGTAGAAITGGNNNVAIGMTTLDVNTTGSENVAIGFQALHAMDGVDDLVAIGNQALVANISGTFLTAVGAYSLDGNTTGNNNTGVGVNAGYRQTTGSDNTFIGYLAGRGTDPTYVGNGLVAIGALALAELTGADNNIGIGLRAGTNVTTGSQNILIGRDTAATLTTGSGNIIIGDSIDVPGATSAGIINIGGKITYGVTANAVRVSGASAGLIIDAGGIDVTGESDFRNHVYYIGGAGFFFRATSAAGFGSGGYFQWTNNTDGAAGTVDTRIRRSSAGVAKVDDNSTGFSATQTNSVAVSALVAAATAGEGARSFVTDADTPVFGSAVTGGGATNVPVYSDGTNWIVG